jgi:hypothetical protein
LSACELYWGGGCTEDMELLHVSKYE